MSRWFGRVGAVQFAAALCLASVLGAAAGVAAPGSEGHAAAEGHGSEGHAAAEGHAAGGHGAHGDLTINWYYGLLGEKPGVEPSLLWRPKGMPTPYLAGLLNTLVLGYVLVRLAKGPVVHGLRSRRERLLKGMEEAARMKAESAAMLAEYRSKLEHIDAEITRVREEMRVSSEAERARILAEAEQRRERLETEARLLIDQELKALQEQLRRETATAALRSARDLLKAQTTTDDHRRLADGYLQDLRLRANAGQSNRPSNGGGRA